MYIINLLNIIYCKNKKNILVIDDRLGECTIGLVF